ncbi:MAG TPA: sugar ABC transporter substrate-binding protein [Pseudolabrys sp.]|nr:sugar ABC transporter substrate-binding protein [Pseudolabrys sp.]
MPRRIAIFTKNRINPGYQGARIGADRTAQRLGAVTSHYVPVRPDDVDDQIALIDRAIGTRPDAVLFTPVHETALNDAIVKFGAAHIPLVNIVARTTAGQRLCFVGSDDEALGFDLARYLFDAMCGRGDVAIVEGADASPTSRARLAGFGKALAHYPGIGVRLSLHGEYRRDIARQAWLQAADRLANVDAVLCANDHMALGVLDALAERGIARLPLIAGVNATPDAIAAIAAGRMLASANFDAMAMGAIGMEAAMRYLDGECVPPDIILPVQIVDRGNCAEWGRPFEERPCPVWDAVIARQASVSLRP